MGIPLCDTHATRGIPDLKPLPPEDDGITAKAVGEEDTAMRQIQILAAVIGLTSVSFMALAFAPIFA